MPGIGCGFSDQPVVAPAIPAAPPALGFTDPYETVTGALPEYQHPGAAYLSEAAGRFTDLAGWSALAGTPDIATGRVRFGPSLAVQAAGHPLLQTVPAGARVRLQWRQGGAGGVRITLDGEVPGDWVQTGGWQSLSLTATAARTALRIEARPGSEDLDIRDMSVEVIAQPAAYDIVLLMGGGNITGQPSGESPDPFVDLPHPLVDVWRGGAAGGAVAPLQHLQANLGLGPGLSFGREYAAAVLAAGRRVLLVPVGAEGSRLVDPGAVTGAEGSVSGWHPLNALTGAADLFSTAVTAARSAQALNPLANRIVAAVWSGGEAEVQDTFQIGAYQSALRNHLIPRLRQDLVRVDLPVVVLGGNPAAMPPIWIVVEGALDEFSGSPDALTGVAHVPWDMAWGVGTRPAPRSVADQLNFSGSANRLRGAAGAVTLSGRLPPLSVTGLIEDATLIEGVGLVAA